MKKLLYYLPIFVFLTAFTCDNEPLEGEFGTGTGSCPEATQAVVEASVNFINATEENYQTLCSAYKVALENLIDACGDPDGSIQLSIDALGSCTDPSDFDDCEALENATNLAEINFINATEENYSDFCLAYKLALENQIEGCGDTGGSLQAIIDGLDCEEDEVLGELIVGGQTYELFSANIINTEASGGELPRVQINLMNVTEDQIFSSDDFIDLVFVYLEIEEEEWQETTYSDFYDLGINVDCTMVDGEITESTTVLGPSPSPDYPENVVLESGSVIINNLTDTILDLTFSFTRVDGVEVSGYYNGDYFQP